MLKRCSGGNIRIQSSGIKYALLSFVMLSFLCASAQNRVVDSLNSLLATAKQDTNKVNLLWNLANEYNAFKPDTARILAEQALLLAEKIKYTEGESRSLGAIANALNQVGNYPRALEYYLRKLKLEENRSNPQNMANVILNIGTVYLYQEQYDKALDYYYQADSIMQTDNDGDPKFGLIIKYSIALDIGDLYNRINRLDSAFIYFQRSLDISKQEMNGDFTGTSMVGIAEVYLKQKQFEKAGNLFITALPYLEAANDEDLICEASWGLANVYDSLNKHDEAKYYAKKMLLLAQKDGFLRWQLKAADFLEAHYKKMNRVDSAYTFLVMSQQLRNSISSADKIREAQVISSNEQLRQTELAEQKIKAKKERIQQLQLLFIGIFIPALFLMTLLLSRRKIHVRVIKFMGIISLLILFEYLTLLLHPYVADITNHTPIIELIIFVAIAAILIRAHHRIEQWFIDKLINSKHRLGDGYFPTRRIKIKMKKPPG